MHNQGYNMPDEIKTLSGGQLAGGNPSAGHRTENDFYATDPQAVTALFNALSKSCPTTKTCLASC